MKHRAISLGFVVILAGCSTAVYKDEIKAFKAATDKATSTVKLYADDSQNHRRQIKIIAAVEKAGKAEIDLNDGCSVKKNADPKSCYVKLNGEPMALENQNLTGVSEEIAELLSLISTYASRLEGIVSAEDNDSLDKEGQLLLTAVTSFAGPLPPVAMIVQ